jgi:hypothetical protein
MMEVVRFCLLLFVFLVLFHIFLKRLFGNLTLDLLELVALVTPALRRSSLTTYPVG